ncbi:MAG: PDZ domain-containing protein [Planctomycetota bacterium]
MRITRLLFGLTWLVLGCNDSNRWAEQADLGDGDDVDQLAGVSDDINDDDFWQRRPYGTSKIESVDSNDRPGDQSNSSNASLSNNDSGSGQETGTVANQSSERDLFDELDDELARDLVQSDLGDLVVPGRQSIEPTDSKETAMDDESVDLESDQLELSSALDAALRQVRVVAAPGSPSIRSNTMPSRLAANRSADTIASSPPDAFDIAVAAADRSVDPDIDVEMAPGRRDSTPAETPQLELEMMIQATFPEALKAAAEPAESTSPSETTPPADPEIPSNPARQTPRSFGPSDEVTIDTNEPEPDDVGSSDSDSTSSNSDTVDDSPARETIQELPGSMDATTIATNQPDPRPWIGAKLRDHDLVILQIEPGSPAEKGGIRIRDQITAIGGESVHSIDEFKQAFTQVSVGDEVKVSVSRDGNPMSLRVQLIQRPPN